MHADTASLPCSCERGTCLKQELERELPLRRLSWTVSLVTQNCYRPEPMGFQFFAGRRRVFHKLTEPLQNCGTNHHQRRHRDLPVPRGSGASPDGGQVRSVCSVLGGNLRRTLFSRSTGRGSCRFSFTVFGRAIAPSGRGGSRQSRLEQPEIPSRADQSVDPAHGCWQDG